MDSGAWNGPVIAQLVVAALTPIAVVVFGWYVTRATKKLESVQWAGQAVVSRRLDIFEYVAPKLNALLCFYTFVGRWKEVLPQEAIALKREIDEAVYAHRTIFSPETLRAYHALMSTMFVMYAKVDGDALLRAKIAATLGDRRNLAWWDGSMEDLFAQLDVLDEQEIWAAHEAFADVLRRELYAEKL